MNETNLKFPTLIRELVNACEAPIPPERCVSKLEELNHGCSSKVFSANSCLTNLEICAPSSAAFMLKYEKLQEKELSSLPKYVELLYHIKQDKNLARVLERAAVKAARLKSTATDSPASLPEVSPADDEAVFVVQNKLLKVVDKITQSRKTIENEESVAPRCSILQKRPYLTQDFVFGFENPHPILPLDGVSNQSQEFYLVQDVLSCMLGCNGLYITVEPISEPYELPNFSVPPHADIHLRNLLVQILPLCSHYSVIARFLREKQPLDSGRINHALAAAISLLMTDYKIFVVQMENLLKRQQLKLDKLWYYSFVLQHPVSVLSKLAQSIGKSKTYGGKTLSVLYKNLTETAADSQTTKIYLYLLKSASMPFFVSLEKWINKGKVFDPFNEFMIIDNADMENGSFMNKGECYDGYWSSRYLIRKDYVPTFLEKIADKILRTGKYLNVIRLCKNKKVKEVLPPPTENLSYDSTNQEYVDAINKAYDFTSSALLKLIMEEYDLVNRFKTAKRYFMLEQGDFLVLLMDSCEAELLKPIDDVDPNRLEVLLELAVRLCSGGKNDDDICMVLHPCQFYFQLLRIFNISTPDEIEFQTLSKEHKSRTGLEAFSIGLIVRWPMSLVFNQRVLLFYQMIFRLLLICKHNERQLCRVWLYDKGVKTLDKQSRQGYLKAFSLRQRMLFFIQNFAFYITEEVIEPNFNSFMKELTKAKDIDYVLQLHLQYLEKSVNECMLTNLSLLENIKLIMSKCTEFCNFILSTWSYSMEAELNPLLSSDYDTKHFIHRFEKQPSLTDSTFKITSSFEETINKLDSSFSKLLLKFLKIIDVVGTGEQFRKLSNVLSRENFNGYYTGDLIKLKKV